MASPRSTFDTIWKAAKANDRDKALACFSLQSLDLINEYAVLYDDLKPTGAHEDPVGLYLEHLRRYPPKVLGQAEEDGTGKVLILYQGGQEEEATFFFVKEDGAWKMNFGRELEPLLRLLKTNKAMLDALKQGAVDTQVKERLEEQGLWPGGDDD